MTYKRWCIVFKHDKSPLDECLFTHKAKAEKKLSEMPNKAKLEVVIMLLSLYVDDKS